MLDKNSEEALRILLKIYEECKSYKIRPSYDDFPEGYHNGLLRIFENLKQYGIIFDYATFLRGSFLVNLFPSALTYFEEKEKALKMENEKQMTQNINIQTLTANGSNINFGSISNSTLSAENIIANLEKQIEEQDEEVRTELKDLLEEVKELCENIKNSSLLPKRTNLMTKISDHLEKHGWFYGAVVQLIGTAAMNAMMSGN